MGIGQGVHNFLELDDAQLDGGLVAALYELVHLERGGIGVEHNRAQDAGGSETGELAGISSS